MSPKLEEWLCMEGVVSALEPITKNAKYVDVDPMFSVGNSLNVIMGCTQYIFPSQNSKSRAGLYETDLGTKT